MRYLYYQSGILRRSYHHLRNAKLWPFHVFLYDTGNPGSSYAVARGTCGSWRNNKIQQTLPEVCSILHVWNRNHPNYSTCGDWHGRLLFRKFRLRDLPAKFADKATWKNTAVCWSGIDHHESSGWVSSGPPRRSPAILKLLSDQCWGEGQAVQRKSSYMH